MKRSHNKHMQRAGMHKVLGRGRSDLSLSRVLLARELRPRRAGADVNRYAALTFMLLALVGAVNAQEASPVSDPSKTTYGMINPATATELRAFSFLIGKWDGKGSTKLPDGTVAEWPVTWIGRYVLDGTAIADELHAPAPDGSPYLGITLRQYDLRRKAWTIEFLNVTGSFLRKQVNANTGSVSISGRNVIIGSESPGMTIREHYLVKDDSNFTYRLDVSTDAGVTWTEGQVEMTFRRLE